jgi:hypothetical protein
MARFDGCELEPFSMMDLDFCAVRRRVYDVINVFEGVGLVQKWNKKNSYVWNGMKLMNQKIEKIKRLASLEQTNSDLVIEISNRISSAFMEENKSVRQSALEDLTNNSTLVWVYFGFGAEFFIEAIFFDTHNWYNEIQWSKQTIIGFLQTVLT